MSAGARIVVVGIGADGWPGMLPSAREAVLAADEVIGSARQLQLLPGLSSPPRSWPSPMAPAIDELVARQRGSVCVLASGDPMLHGIGATLAARVDPGRLTVIPHVSAFTLACARLCWPEADVELISAVARPVDVVARALQPRRRIIAYASGRDGAAAVARAVCQRGYGLSRFVVLERLGAADERISEGAASEFVSGDWDPLHTIAIQCRPDPGISPLPRVPGLRDAAYHSDGALTKWPVRAITLAALAPLPGALLWDVGAGSGSVAIEWLRAEPSARAIALEKRSDRRELISRNAVALGIPELQVIAGEAPAALVELPAPDAVFVGGGLSAPGMLRACWNALTPGGRIVVNAVTLEGEAALSAAHAEHGGGLLRVEVAHAAPIGGFSGWRPQMPVVQWSATKP